MIHTLYVIYHRGHSRRLAHNTSPEQHSTSTAGPVLADDVLREQADGWTECNVEQLTTLLICIIGFLTALVILLAFLLLMQHYKGRKQMAEKEYKNAAYEINDDDSAYIMTIKDFYQQTGNDSKNHRHRDASAGSESEYEDCEICSDRDLESCAGHSFSRSSSLNERERAGFNFLEELCYYEHMKEQTGSAVTTQALGIPLSDSRLNENTTPMIEVDTAEYQKSVAGNEQEYLSEELESADQVSWTSNPCCELDITDRDHTCIESEACSNRLYSTHLTN